MGAYSRSDILSAVRKEIDEIRLNDASFIASDIDGSELDTIILHQFGEAVNFCYDNADMSLLTPKQVPAVDISALAIGDGSNQSIRIDGAPSTPGVMVERALLGTQFARLCYARNTSWNREVTEPLFWNSDASAKLHNWYTTGTPERPVVYINRDANTGGFVAYLYCCKTGSSTQVAIIEKPSYNEASIGDGSTSLFEISDERIYRAAITYTAALTLLTLKDEHADDLFNLAYQKMGLKTNNNG